MCLSSDLRCSRHHQLSPRRTSSIIYTVRTRMLHARCWLLHMRCVYFYSQQWNGASCDRMMLADSTLHMCPHVNVRCWLCFFYQVDFVWDTGNGIGKVFVYVAYPGSAPKNGVFQFVVELQSLIHSAIIKRCTITVVTGWVRSHWYMNKGNNMCKKVPQMQQRHHHHQHHQTKPSFRVHDLDDDQLPEMVTFLESHYHLHNRHTVVVT